MQHASGIFKLLKHSESQYVPSEISIQGRTTHWDTYRVQGVKFQLDGFNDDGRGVYAGSQRGIKKVRKSFGPGFGKMQVQFLDEKSDNQKMIYLVHD